MSAKSFRLTVTDVFPNPPEGAILLGTIEQGEVSIGDTIPITAGLEEVRVSVTGIEIFRAVLQTATTGQEVGLRIRGVDPDLIAAGSIVKAADFELIPQLRERHAPTVLIHQVVHPPLRFPVWEMRSVLFDTAIKRKTSAYRQQTTTASQKLKRIS